MIRIITSSASGGRSRSMFLRHSVFASAFCFMAIASVPAAATTYTITSVIDAEAADGACTLREAIKAISSRKKVNECEAGTGGDVISLTEGDRKSTRLNSSHVKISYAVF